MGMDEYDTGDRWICPKCEKVFRLIVRNNPRSNYPHSHKLEKVKGKDLTDFEEEGESDA